MRIDILAIGSRGDVQPHVALGLGLKSAGHQVRVVTLGGFEELVLGHGLEHLAIGGVGPVGHTEAGRSWVDGRASVIGFLRGFVRVAVPLIEQSINSYWPHAQDAELLIASPMGLLVGAHVAERLDVPLVRTQFAPRHDCAGRDTLKTAVLSSLNGALGAAFALAIWSQLRPVTNVARREVLGLPPVPLMGAFSALDRARVPMLDAYSPALVPRPRHWGDWIHVTGYWFLDHGPDWVPPPLLVDFLEAGPPPVFVGFGSTPFPRPEASTAIIVGALKRAGQRGLLVAGGSGLPTGVLSDDVVSVPSVPHGWLFRRVSAAVHQGGAGVTAAALRAGVPSVVIPVFADQPFWARRVEALGAGPRPIPAQQVTEAGLADAIRLTVDPAMRRRAAALGARIQAEDGVGCAVAAIHQHLGYAHHAAAGQAALRTADRSAGRRPEG